MSRTAKFHVASGALLVVALAGIFGSHFAGLNWSVYLNVALPPAALGLWAYSIHLWRSQRIAQPSASPSSPIADPVALPDENLAALRFMANALPLVVFSIRLTREREFKINFINDCVFDFYGYTPDEVKANPMLFCLSAIEEDRPILDQALESWLATRKPFDVEYRIQHKNGTVRWCQSASTVFAENSDGSITFVGFEADITDLKEQQLLLTKSNNELVRYKELIGSFLNNIPQAIACYDEDWRLFAYNRHYLDAYGIDPSRVRLGMTWRELSLEAAKSGALGPGDPEELASKAVEGARQKSMPDKEEWTSPSGRIFDYTANRLPGLRFMEAMQDITSIRQAERQIRRITESLPLIVFELRRKGGMVPKYSYLTFGQSNIQALSNAEWRDFDDTFENIHPDDRGRVYQELCRVLDQESEWRSDYRVVSDSGDITWLHSEGHSQRQPDGSLLLTGFSQDVTSIKQAGEALIEARNQAERANRLKGEFLVNMSHEIRTPMNAILGMSHLLQKSELTQSQRQHIERMQAAARGLLSILNDILDLSKIEAGKLTVDLTEFNLDDLVAQLTAVVAEQTAEKALEFVVRIDPICPRAFIGDRLRIRQVLVNLVSNAVKFTNQGEVVVRIWISDRTGERANLNFSVEDTGIGMTSEQMRQLFQPFVQLDGSTTRRFGGTGLGLNISRSLVELMGGEIRVESTPKVGSKFSFSVRVSIAAPVQALPETQALPRLKVMVVDDNAVARDVISEQLMFMGLAVTAVEDSTKALALLRDQGTGFDVVLVDWRMPGTDGLALGALIRADATIKQPKIILISGQYLEPAIQNEASRLLDGILVKPFSSAELTRSIAQLVGIPDASKTELNEEGGSDLSDLQGKRVLVVEDNEINRDIVKELLTGWGILVEEAQHGAAAVELLTQSDPDAFALVLMDIQMPVMDGYKATDKIREDHRFDRLPVIALTAHTMQEEQERCLEHGMQEHLAKPIEPDELLNVLKRWLLRKATSAVVGDGASAVPAETQTTATLAESAITLDVAEGLRRCADNTSVYANILRKFAEYHANAPTQMQNALNEGRRQDGARIAHTIRGLAGSIGARPLAEHCARLERLIDGGQTNLDREFEQLVVLSATTLEAVKQAVLSFGIDSAPQAGDPTSSVDVRVIISALLGCLAESDGSSIDILDRHSAALRRHFGQTKFESIRSAIEQYDFEGAAALIEPAS